MKRTSMFADFLLKFNLEGFLNHCDSRIALDFIYKFKLFCKSTCVMLTLATVNTVNVNYCT